MGITCILVSPATPKKLLDTMFSVFLPFTVIMTPGTLHSNSACLAANSHTHALSVAVAEGGAAQGHHIPTRTSVLHQNLGSSSRGLRKGLSSGEYCLWLAPPGVLSIKQFAKYACMHDEDR